jgi:hypothetical protein
LAAVARLPAGPTKPFSDSIPLPVQRTACVGVVLVDAHPTAVDPSPLTPNGAPKGWVPEKNGNGVNRGVGSAAPADAP